MKLYHITHKDNLDSILFYGIISKFQKTSCFSNSLSNKKYNHLPFKNPIFLTGDVEYAIKRMGSWNSMEDLVYIEVDIPCDYLQETEYDFELVYDGFIIEPSNIVSYSTSIPKHLNVYWVR